MTHRTHILALAAAAVMAASTAQAACYADYKAKRDNPLRLHYGVMEISDPCTRQSARAQIADRLGATNWTLLTVLGTFGDEGLQERKASAGKFFLRY